MLELRLLLVGLFDRLGALLLRLRGFRGRAVRGVALRDGSGCVGREAVWRRAAERFGCVWGQLRAAPRRGFSLSAAVAFGVPAAVAALRRFAEALRGGRRARGASRSPVFYSGAFVGFGRRQRTRTAAMMVCYCWSTAGALLKRCASAIEPRAVRSLRVKLYRPK